MIDMTTLDALQWAGCATGVAGAFILALNTKHSGWGFVLFLISNGFWMMYGIETKALGLVTSQVVFTLTSLIGIYRWLVAARR
jgi:nicotinamide riboside transporter PnuC